MLDPTQFSVVQTIHCNVGLKCFLSILPKCLFVIIVIYAYFVDISQSSVETHLRCGGTCNNHVIANCPQSVPVKEFGNRSIIGEDVNKSEVSWFFGLSCTYVHVNVTALM